MAAKKTPKTQSKSDFIRKQPATLSPAEVVAKGKAEGIKFSPQLVYNVRGGSKSKKGAAKKTTASTSTSAPAKSTQSKADFVRARPHLSPKEIVKEGKAEGVKLAESYVYNVRGYDKAKKAGNKKPARAAAPATKPSAPTVTKARATPRTAPP